MIWIGIYSLLLLILFSQVLIVYLLFKKNAPSSDIQIKDENMQNQTNIDSNQLSIEWEEEIKRTIELQCMRIRNAVQKQTNDIHKKEIELAPKNFSYNQNILANVYDEKQLTILNHYIEAFQAYLDKFWFTKDGRLKTVFSGKPTNSQTETGQLILASHELCDKMDRWFDELCRRN